MANLRLHVERREDSLIVTPPESISTVDWQRVLMDIHDFLAPIRNGGVQTVIVDLKNAEYAGTWMLQFINLLWRQVQSGGGKMVVCNVSDVGREILARAKLDTVWPVHASREDALTMAR